MVTINEFLIRGSHVAAAVAAEFLATLRSVAEARFSRATSGPSGWTTIHARGLRRCPHRVDSSR